MDALPHFDWTYRDHGILPVTMQEFSQSPLDPDFVQDPYPVYDAMRACGDVVFWKDYDMPAIVGFDAVKAALTHRQMGRTPPADRAKPPLPHTQIWAGLEAHSMLELEPPHHTRLRGLVLRAFTSRSIAALGPQIAQIARDLIDAFPDTPFDFLRHYAAPLPVQVIAHMLGVPASHCDNLLTWSNAMVAMYQASRTRAVEDVAEQATQDFTAFLKDLIAHKKRTPAKDLITNLIAAEADGEKLSEPELISTIILLLNAGHEATVHTLGNGLWALSQNNWPATTDQTIEEIMRYDPPLHIFIRWTYGDVEIAGTTIPKGTEVACMLAAANRDPRAFADPHAFDSTRTAKQNASFGAGIHFCVGAPLARLELSIGLKVLQQRCPTLSVAGPPRYANTYHFHGLEQLMVRLGQRQDLG